MLGLPQGQRESKQFPYSQQGVCGQPDMDGSRNHSLAGICGSHKKPIIFVVLFVLDRSLDTSFHGSLDIPFTAWGDRRKKQHEDTEFVFSCFFCTWLFGLQFHGLAQKGYNHYNLAHTLKAGTGCSIAETWSQPDKFLYISDKCPWLM